MISFGCDLMVVVMGVLERERRERKKRLRIYSDFVDINGPKKKTIF